jgi:hypothetical protein
VTGLWTDADQTALDDALNGEHGPPVNDDDEMVLVPRSLITSVITDLQSYL